jgi:tRNA(His) 5'-end guanylyltransferase
MIDKKSDPLGDRVKELESASAKIMLNDDLPLCVRLDGKAFHTFTKGLKRPYDKRLSDAMISTMNYLVEKTDAKLGYTQSDEITLVYFKTANHQQGYFGSRMQKLVSVLASMATAKFNVEVQKNIPEKADILAFFDCRVWNVPELKDAAEVFIWRQDDAVKNAVSMAAHAYYGDKPLFKKSSVEKMQMLKDKGVEWSEYPEFFKSGTYAMRMHQEIEMPENLTKFKTNEGKTSYLRSYINNFHFPRLRHLENVTDILFKPVFDEYRISIVGKLTKKSKK